jgi:hypothetical protein
MTRNIDAALLATLDDAWLNPVLFVKMEFDDGTLYLHNDLGDIIWGGFTWLGTGDLGQVGEIEERDDRSPTGVVLRLSGIDTTLLNELANEDHFDRPVTIYLGVRDASSGALVSTPFEIFAGTIDHMTGASGTPTSMIEEQVESELMEFDNTPAIFFSDAQQQKNYPGDLGLKFLEAMANLKLKVGSNQTILISTGEAALTPRQQRRRERRGG